MNFNIKPGQKLCSRCTKKVNSLQEDIIEKVVDPDLNSKVQILSELNESLTALGCSPLKHVSQRDHLSYPKTKIARVADKSTEKLTIAYDLPESTLRTPFMKMPMV